MPTRRTWTDDDLARVVASSTTYAGVLKQLGLGRSGGSHYNIKARIRELGLDVSHFGRPSLSSGAWRPWTEEQLRAAVDGATSLVMVLERLGLDPSRGRERRLRRHMAELGLAIANPRNRRRRRWRREELEAAIASSQGYAETIRKLGLVPAGGNYDLVKREIRELELDTSHFVGSRWARGRKLPSRVPLVQLLVANRWTGTHSLKKRLFKEGLKPQRCELCGWAERAPDGRVPLELDHVSGDRTDNRLENLRILCPNCHALQPTHRGLNKQSRRGSRRIRTDT